MAIIFLRTLILFICLLTATRVMGKRQVGELEPSELVVAVLISDIAAHPLQDISIPMLNALVPIIVLPCLEIIVTMLTLKSLRFRSFVCGKPTVIIENGRIIEREMRRSRVSLDELTLALRRKDIVDIGSVRCAVLETDGSLTALLYASEKPPSASLCGITAQDKPLPVVLINDGRLLSDNLRFLGKDGKWLQTELRKNGAKSVSEVFYFTCDSGGKTYFLPKSGGRAR